MATWITHMMVADSVMQKLPWLDCRGFCVGNIAPDCNIENEDWTAFTPPREVTHWMGGSRKEGADAERFIDEYILKRDITNVEEYSFLLGYYAHLAADAEFQRMIRDSKRVENVWKRIDHSPKYYELSADLPRTWDTVKKIISKKDRFKEIYSIEGTYLRNNPNSGYFTEILSLIDFPDYIDYLPDGAIVRKIPKMIVNEELLKPIDCYISITPEEVADFVKASVGIITSRIERIGALK